MSDIKDWFTKRQRWDGMFILEPAVPGVNMLFHLVADGATTDMNVNGSGTAVEYDYASPAPKISFVERVHFLIQDNSIEPALFGGLAALSNGLKIEHIDTDGTTVLYDFTEDLTIKKNLHFGLYAGRDVPFYSSAPASIPDAVLVRWTIGKIGSPLLLKGDEIFRVTVQDDLRNLDEFLCMVQGHIWDEGVFDDIADSSTDR